jgi:predicted amidohydrolase
MRVSCVLDASQLDAETPDLIVFPEGVEFAQLQQVHANNPHSMVIGAVLGRTSCRGVLLHRGRNQVDYLKAGPYEHTKGNGGRNQRPVYRSGDACVGVLICMDVNCAPLASAVAEQVKSSKSEFKIICIPSDMSADWFQGEELSGSIFDGVHVAMCNNTKTYVRTGCRSFITDTQRKKITTQTPGEPIHAWLPYS